jgi:hypothetical protein
MIDRLDLLLDEVREDEPTDEAFVQLVMRDVRADETRRVGRRALRRPFIVGIAAAAVVCGGAVAAVVGTNPSKSVDDPTIPKATASVRVTDAPRASAKVTDEAAAPSRAPTAVVSSSPSGDAGKLTDHSSFVVDRATGLRLQTETYTTAFGVSEPQRVTLALSNTGEYPIAVSGPRGCTLQVMAVPAGEAPAKGIDPSAYGGRFAWACAGSQEDPRVQAADESFMLKPGQRLTADASISLAQAGDWDVMGICRCSYKQVRPTPVPKESDPLDGLTTRTLPSPLLPESTDGENLTTPPVRVRAS